MPIIKSAIKRVKQAERRRERNVATKRAIKDATKAFEAKPTADSLAKVHSELDKALKKNLLHKNTVARRKSAVAMKAKNAGVKLSTTKKSATPVAKKPATTKAPAKKPATKTATKKPAAKKAPVKKKPATKK